MKAYFRILGYGREFLGKVVVAFLSLGLYNILNAVSLTLIIPFLEILFAEPDPEATTQTVNWAEGGVKENIYTYLEQQMAAIGKYDVLLWFCVVVGVAILLKNLFRYLSAFLLAEMEQGIIRNIRNALFDHLCRLSLGFYTRKRKGHIVNTVVNDVQIVQQGVVGTLMNLFSDPLTIIVFFVMMTFISWKLTLFTLIVLPLTGLFISRIAKTLKKKAHAAQTKFDELLAVFDEFLSGIRIVKAFGAEENERQKHQRLNQQYMDIMVSFKRRNVLASPLTEVLSTLVVLAIILYGSNLVMTGSGELKASEFIGFVVLFSQFLAPIKTFSSAITRVQKAIASFSRIENLLGEEVLATETSGTQELETIEEGFRLEEVSFAYGEESVLHNISLDIPVGQTVALVGPSGAGKSTLVDLICRFYDPTTGRILADGKDLRTLEGRKYRRLMGIVTQEAILFNDTIENNIRFGREGLSREAVEEAARVANAHQFIRELPEGYDTLAGERGGRLSGGQRQRIAIARAVATNPPVLVLDEATSALDSESEALVQAALQRLMKGRTAIVIAHRLSTITHADTIVVMGAGGHILATGTHQELLATSAEYEKMCRQQFVT